MKLATELAICLFLVGASVASADTSAAGQPVYTDSQGREWLDAVSFGNQSPAEMRRWCDLETGACAGIYGSGANAIDLTGYQWADRDEVRDLFYDIGQLQPGSLDDYSYSAVGTHAAADRFFSAFARNDPNTSGSPWELRALIRAPSTPVPGYGAVRSFYVASVARDRPDSWYSQGEFESFSITDGLLFDPDQEDRMDYTGNFLYRVPEPGTFALLALGLAGLGVARRKRSV